MNLILHEDIYADVKDGDLAELLGMIELCLKKHSAILAGDVVLRLAFCQPPRTPTRSSKLSNTAILELLISTAQVTPICKNDRYEFNFQSKAYVYAGKAIHLTAKEQLSLYYLLIRKEHPKRIIGWAQTHNQLKKKFGDVFIKDVIDACTI